MRILSDYWIVLAAMIFCHLIDDYIFQGCMADMKQSAFWEKNYPDEKYKNDYKIVLFEHGFKCSFVMMIPVFVQYYILWHSLSIWLFVIFLANTIVHAIIDDFKANKLKINLVQDQICHLIQAIVTWLICVGMYINRII
ncbi:MAG: hypothetical protein LUE92_03195 [Clostridiales bacterium]|nr:hypothetical protein [Clostridiales bacterium]